MVVFESSNPPYMVAGGKKQHQNPVFENTHTSIYGLRDRESKMVLAFFVVVGECG